MKPARYVYFVKPVGADGPIKIGCSEVPLARLRSLADWSPFPLEIMVAIPGDYGLERRLHNRFFSQRSHREWFHASPELAAFIEKLKQGVPVGEAVDLDAVTGRMGPTRTNTPERSACLSFEARLRHQERALGTDRHYFTAPEDVRRILNSLQTYDRATGRSVYRPATAAEAARVEEVIADPAAHLVQQPRFRSTPKAAPASTEAA